MSQKMAANEEVRTTGNSASQTNRDEDISNSINVDIVNSVMGNPFE